MDLTKVFEFFNPNSVKGKIHIIGCGSVGSTLAMLLARTGLRNFVLYDFDIVEEHNIVNQMFTEADIKKPKVIATRDLMVAINGDLKDTIEICADGYTGQRLNGYVFLAVDNIDLRRKICEENRDNHSIKAIFDFRTRLTDGQHYAADWANVMDIKNLIATMDFSHEEAHAETPTTACGIELGVAPTVVMVCCVGVSNFINMVMNKPYKTAIPYISPFAADIF